MKKKAERILAVLMTLVMLITAAPLAGMDIKVSAFEYCSGALSDTVFWDFDDSTGTLTINGIGDVPADAVSIITGSGVSTDSIEKLIVGGDIENILSSGEIGDGTFSRLTNLCSVTLDGVKTVGSFAFENCSITELDLGDVEIIRYGAFKSDTSYVDSLVIPASLDIAESWSLSLDVNSLSFEEGFDGLSIVDENSYAPFADSELDNVVLPETLTTVTQWLFNQADIYIMTIPGTVTEIEEHAFSGTDLSEIHYLGIRSQWNAITIGDNNDGLDYVYILYSSSEPVYLNDTVYYILDEVAGTLKIGGTGATPDYGMRSDQNSPFTSETMWFTEVIIEEGITRIGDALFYDCYVKNVQFADSVESIGKNAFDCCSILEEIYIPKTVKTVEGGAFYECYHLEKITVDPESQYLCSVDGVLYNKDMTSLICYPARKTDKTEFVLPDSVETVEPFAFGANETLKKIVLSDGTSEVSAYAFAICALNEIDFGKSLTVLHTDLFFAGSVPGVLHIPETLTTIEDEVFVWCSNFEVYYAGSPSQWRAVAVGDNNDALLGVKIHYGKADTSGALSDTVSYTYDEKTGVLTISGTGAIPTYASADESLFADISFSEIVIEEGITEIGSFAFAGCDIGTAALPKSIESIKDNAFADATAEKIILCCDITELNVFDIDIGETGNDIFDDDKIQYLITDRVSETITACFNSETATLTFSGTGAMPDYSSESPDTYGHYSRISEIKNVVFEEGITHIGDYTLVLCDGIESITLPDSLESIGEGAFVFAEGLKTVTLGKNVSEIGDAAFGACYALEKFNVSDENTTFCSIDGVLYSKDKKELVLFPAGKEASEYTIADGTETIGTTAFLECDKLTSVTIPASVTVIENNAFDGTDNLKTVYYPGSQSEWQSITIADGNISFRNADIVCLADVAPFKSESGVEIDIEGTTLYANGFNPGTTAEEVSAMAEDGWTVSVETADGSDRIGTGSVITMKNGDVEIDYVAIVYGDTTGDSWYDGQDAIVTNCFANGLLSREQVGNAVFESADCNHDGVIDSADVALLEQAGVILASVDQSKSPAELMTDSAYVEYLNLIEQTVGTETSDVVEDEPVDEGINKSFIERIIDFIIYIVNLMKTFIAKF